MPFKILVVDDEPDLELLIRQKFRRQIREKELEFAFAHNGVEALEALKADRDIEMVLTDINMPVMDGLTLLGKISDLNAMLKTIVVSAYGDMENIRAAMNRGAYDFLTKPIDLTDLEVTISKTRQRIEVLRESAREHKQLIEIQNELNVATNIQRSILPCDFPPFPGVEGFELYAEMIPAREVGGDFYDFFLLDKERLGLVIGDVSGKGVPAAIFMAVTRTMLKSVALTGLPAGECLRQVNRLISLENTSYMFVTLYYAILNIMTGEFEFSNAGHNLPYLIPVQGEARMLPADNGIVLGIDENYPYRTEKLQLTPGDIIFLYTDGITEAFNQQKQMYTDERLHQCLKLTPGSSPKEIIQRVVEEVTSFAGNEPQSDDLTMMAARYHP
ncbi:MAG: SpoIIE family protein phosphatase [Acidobacteria bacterium]|nr:SpoIIE family protein phosphatase [Acidobacteriota bacterium]